VPNAAGCTLAEGDQIQTDGGVEHSGHRSQRPNRTGRPMFHVEQCCVLQHFVSAKSRRPKRFGDSLNDTAYVPDGHGLGGLSTPCPSACWPTTGGLHRMPGGRHRHPTGRTAGSASRSARPSNPLPAKSPPTEAFRKADHHRPDQPRRRANRPGRRRVVGRHWGGSPEGKGLCCFGWPKQKSPRHLSRCLGVSASSSSGKNERSLAPPGSGPGDRHTQALVSETMKRQAGRRVTSRPRQHGTRTRCTGSPAC